MDRGRCVVKLRGVEVPWQKKERNGHIISSSNLKGGECIVWDILCTIIIIMNNLLKDSNDSN